MAGESDRYDPLRESHARIAAELQKVISDVQAAETSAIKSQSTPSPDEQRQLDRKAERAATAQIAAENAPTRPDFQPGFTIRSADIGDVVVQPSMWRQGPVGDGQGQSRSQTQETPFTQTPIERVSTSAVERTAQHVQARTEARTFASQTKNKKERGALHGQRSDTREPISSQARRGPIAKAVASVRAGISALTSFAAKAMDGLASLFESFFGGTSEPKPVTPHEIAAAEHREVEAEKIIERDALAGLSAEDTLKLRQEMMRQFGREIAQESERDGGRER